MTKQIKTEMNQVIDDLEKKGVDVNSHFSNMKGLGDLVEETLQKFGITEERFKAWFGLKECGCSKRKKWLNGIFKWRVNK